MYYKKQRTSRRHSRLRRLPRDAREGERHPGRRQHHARPSARQHQHRGAEEGQGGDLAQAGGERALRAAPHARGRARAARRPRTCSPTATAPTGTRWRRGSTRGAIGTVREVHNWTDRPFWPQGMQDYHASGPAVPDGFNWALWQGPEPERPYHPSYTLRGLSRLVCVRHRLPWRHGALQPVAAVPHPQSRRAGVRRGPAEQRGVGERSNVSTGGRVSTRRLAASEHRALAASRDGGASGCRHVLVRRRHEAADAGRGLCRWRGSRRRGNAHHRRQGQDPAATSAATRRGSFRAAASRHSSGSIPMPEYDTTSVRR